MGHVIIPASPLLPTESDYIRADVNDSFPRFLVVEFADVAARNSKARRVKLPRTFPF